MASARAPMTMEPIGLGGVLKRYWLKVPPNQREYSWDELNNPPRFGGMLGLGHAGDAVNGHPDGMLSRAAG